MVITISNSALPAHAKHGDVMPGPNGACESGDPTLQSRIAGPDRGGASAFAGTPAAAAGAAGAASDGTATDGSATSEAAGGGAVLAALASGEHPSDAAADEEGGSGSDGELPFTGLGLTALLSIGVVLLASGWLSRRLFPGPSKP